MSPFGRETDVVCVSDGSHHERCQDKATPCESRIGETKLYLGMEQRVDRELQFLRKRKQEEKLDIEPLSKFDCMNFGGHDSVDAAVKTMEKLVNVDGDTTTRRKTFLDIGSGLGGPSRCLASRTGGTVIALELQGLLDKKARELSKACRLSRGEVQHVHGDILDYCDQEKENNHATHSNNSDLISGLDGIVSWLSFLHISDKTRLFRICHDLLKPEGGVLYCEDLYVKQPLTSLDVELLEKDLSCTNLLSKKEYWSLLKKSGFIHIKWIDMTNAWITETRQRLQNLAANKQYFIKLHGSLAYTQMHGFYTTILLLLEGGNLGGVRYVAQKRQKK